MQSLKTFPFTLHAVLRISVEEENELPAKVQDPRLGGVGYLGE